MRTLLPRRRAVAFQQHAGELVHDGEFRQVPSVCLRRPEDEPELIPEPGRWRRRSAGNTAEKSRSSRSRRETYVPERKRNIMLFAGAYATPETPSAAVTVALRRGWAHRRRAFGSYTRACGNRTLVPYTAPLRGALDNRQYVMVPRIEDDALDGGLRRARVSPEAMAASLREAERSG